MPWKVAAVGRHCRGRRVHAEGVVLAKSPMPQLCTCTCWPGAIGCGGEADDLAVAPDRRPRARAAGPPPCARPGSRCAVTARRRDRRPLPSGSRARSPPRPRGAAGSRSGHHAPRADALRPCTAALAAISIRPLSLLESSPARSPSCACAPHMPALPQWIPAFMPALRHLSGSACRRSRALSGSSWSSIGVLPSAERQVRRADVHAGDARHVQDGLQVLDRLPASRSSGCTAISSLAVALVAGRCAIDAGADRAVGPLAHRAGICM